MHDGAAHVGVPAPQTPQVIPLVPQAPFAAPATQLPPLQHPPLHSVWFVPRHALPHVCVLVLQASPGVLPLAAGQSDCELQPHVSVVGSHTAPLKLPTQLMHVPDAPHVGACVPAMQAAPEQQKPPLHVPSPPAPHADVHPPPAQVGVPAPQTAHVCPAAPQAPFVPPAMQVPPWQQPPLHRWVASQVLEQTCVLPQASCAGQSAELLQPQNAPLSHTWPFAEVVQLEHVPPPPHAPGAAPVAHVPVDEQQPPLHPVVPVLHVAEQL